MVLWQKSAVFIWYYPKLFCDYEKEIIPMMIVISTNKTIWRDSSICRKLFRKGKNKNVASLYLIYERAKLKYSSLFLDFNALKKLY